MFWYFWWNLFYDFLTLVCGSEISVKGNDYGNGNNSPDVDGNGNDGNLKNGNIIETEMKTFKTYRNGNVRNENEKKT